MSVVFSEDPSCYSFLLALISEFTPAVLGKVMFHLPSFKKERV